MGTFCIGILHLSVLASVHRPHRMIGIYVYGFNRRLNGFQVPLNGDPPSIYGRAIFMAVTPFGAVEFPPLLDRALQVPVGHVMHTLTNAEDADKTEQVEVASRHNRKYCSRALHCGRTASSRDKRC